MLVNRSLFPVNRGFNVITDMQRQMERFQVQLATGERAQTLSELGSGRVYDLVLRARQERFDAYGKSIKTIDLRLDFLDNALSRLDEIEADARTAAVGSGAGPDGLNQATARALAEGRLDEVLTLLNTEVNGRYLMAGRYSDMPPVPTLSQIMNGANGVDGFRTVVNERKLADAGLDGKGRVVLDSAQLTSGLPAADTVSLTEESAVLHPLRPQITGISTSNPAQITLTGPAGVPVSVSAQFSATVVAGDTVTINMTQPDGTLTPQTFTAVAGVPATPNQFQIGVTAAATANNFKAALDGLVVPDSVTLREDGVHPFGMKISTLSTSSTQIATSVVKTPATAGVNTFAYAADALAYGATDTTTFSIAVNGGAPVPVTINQAIVSGVGDLDNVIDTIGEMTSVLSAALTAAGVTGVTIANNGTNITLTSNTPGATSNVTISAFLANADGGGNANTGGGLANGAGTTGIAAAPSRLSLRFTGLPTAGSTISLTMAMPDGSEHVMSFRAVAGAPSQKGDFQIGATAAATNANFETAFNSAFSEVGPRELAAASTYAAGDAFFVGNGQTAQRVAGPPFETATALVAATPADTLQWYRGESTANPRQSVQVRIDDTTTVNYGVQGNESGFRNLVKALASVAVNDFSTSDPAAGDRYEAMLGGQTKLLSESNNSVQGSIEMVSLELGLVKATTGSTLERQTTYGSQIEGLLADIEQVSIEEVGVTILALKTRLEASFQTMSVVSNLSLVNYLNF